MKISLIIPVYNKEDFVVRCIDSLINQTYEDIEIIAIDDGSTDDSLKILNELEKKDQRMKVFHQDNAGVSAARNRGLLEATGDYVYFIDGDDYLIKDACEKMIKATNNGIYDMVICKYQIENSNGRVNVPVEINKQEWDTGTEKAVIDFYYTGRKIGTGIANKMFSMKIIRENNLQFPKLKIGEDAIFIIEFLKKSNRWYFINDVLYSYCMNNNSVMHTVDISIVDNMIELMNAYNNTIVGFEDIKEARIAISTFCVRDVFTISKFAYNSKTKFKDRYRWFRNEMKKKEIYNFINEANISKLSFKFKVVYWCWKYKLPLMIVLMVKMYKLTVNN